MDIHQAAYEGNAELVKNLLMKGVDPNCSHEANSHWISGPTPLNKVCIAWSLTPAHIDIAKTLIEHGAVVDDSHFGDFMVESFKSDIWLELLGILQAAAGENVTHP